MNTTENQFLTFFLDDQKYGLPISCIKEINRMTDITSLPNTKPYVRGVLNLRGKVIPVVDLRLKFDMPEVDATKHTCIVVIEAKFGDLGIVVDAVDAVVNVDGSQIEPPPELDLGTNQNHLLGLAKLNDDVIIIIDVLRSFSKEEIAGITAEHEEASAA